MFETYSCLNHIMEALIFVIFFTLISSATSDTFSVKIGVESHVNVVDSRFLSFTIDPKYLFSSSDKYKSKECICMASSLTPAYIRIAGPSTSSMTFQNATIAINELDEDSYKDAKGQGRLAVSHRKWRKFVQWAKSTGFDLVFALNNEEKTSSGIWDPNRALNILTVAEKANIGDIFWQLGYECNDQSIEEYLNDLETLRVIIETFAPGRAGQWRVVGGDVSNCLHADSKSDFKDYITLSDDMMDAVMLNGNSSSHELLRMSEVDRMKLLRHLSQSTTPLWLTENPRSGDNEVERAADWLSSLGYSARNGFSVHFRELLEEEMYEPTLSFYMALLFKNLVGERVLDVELESDQSVLFAHCTSLRHKAVPGAVTIYGANMDEEVARFSIKMNKREEGGDIMQFVISQDHSGNIIVNGRPMYHEGDIKPAVKRVRPYKTLLINLPPKSFGFWVLANTNIEACQYFEGNNDTSEPTSHHISEEESIEVVRVKRLVEDQRCQDNNTEITVKRTYINPRSNNILSSGVNSECSKTTSKYIQNLENLSDFTSLKNTLLNKTNNSQQKYLKSVINTETVKEKNLQVNEILDLDNVIEVEIKKEDNKVQENNFYLDDDFDVSRKSFQNSNMKTKRNIENQDTPRTDADNAGSSSVTHSTKKPKRPDDRSKRRQSMHAPKGKRFENTKASKLRRSEDNEPNKLERLKAKLFKNKDLEFRSSILDNILSKRNSRLKNERRKLRLGQNKLSKRNSRITKKRDSSKNDFNEEKTTRFRRSVSENFLTEKKLTSNNFNDNINTSSRIVRNADMEHKSLKNHRKKTSTADENIYATDKNVNKLTDHVRIKTLKSVRNVHNIKNQTGSDENTMEKRSNEENWTQEQLQNQRNFENKAISNKSDGRSISRRTKISRSSRNVDEKGKNIPADISENEIEHDDIENTKLWKILRKIHTQLKDLSSERDAYYDTNTGEMTIDDYDQNTKEDSGLIKSTINNLLKVLRELNKNLNRFWSGVNLLD